MRKQKRRKNPKDQPWIKNSIKEWGSLTELGTLNIDSVKEILHEKAFLWDENTSRQKSFKVHQFTKNIILYWSEDNIGNINGEVQYHEKNCEIFQDCISDIKSILQGIYLFEKMKIYKLALVGLVPNGIIRPHIDTAIPLRCVNRIHIPIITHPHIKTYIDHKEYHLEAGKIYNFNNTLLHSVKNTSDLMRVHIIVDVQDENVYVEKMNSVISQIPTHVQNRMIQRVGSGTTVLNDKND